MDKSQWIERITHQLKDADVIRSLCEQLSESDLESLLLHVFRERSRTRTLAEILGQYEQNVWVRPAGVDPRLLLELERAAFVCAAGFEPVELAPVAPRGVNTALGGVDPDQCFATVRGVEVLADPTTAAALECARRRRAGVVAPILLSSRSRVLRVPGGAMPHSVFPSFGLFSLVTSVRRFPAADLEVEALRRHLSVYVDLLGAVQLRDIPIEVSVSDTEGETPRLAQVETEVLPALRLKYPGIGFAIDRGRSPGSRYYIGLCVRVDAVREARDRRNLAEGGFTDWTQRLLDDEAEQLFVSAIGLERVLAMRA